MTKREKEAKKAIVEYAGKTAYFDNTLTESEMYEMFKYRFNFGEAETQVIIASLILTGAKFKKED